MRRLSRALVAGLLGAGAALLVSCSGSGKGLIPPANAGPLKDDFEAIAQAAQSGQGSCTSTEAAIVKAEGDLAALPASLNDGLRKRLHKGMATLRENARRQCERTTTPSTTTTAPTTTETTPTQSTTTETTPTQSTSTTNTNTTPGPGGGTPAPGEEGEQEEGSPEAASQSFKGQGHKKKHGPKVKGDALRLGPGVRP